VDEYGRVTGSFTPVREDLHHFAPVPLIYRDLGFEDLDDVNRELAGIARRAFDAAVLEVPDRRHVEDLGRPPEMRDELWTESQVTAVGVWHRVPTNNLLDLPQDTVKRLRSVVEERYLFALSGTGALAPGEHVEPVVTESWIQFYKNCDDKVLHNHGRYGPPYPEHQWSGAYYLDDGDPDPDMPFSGVFSFRVRGENHFVRPRAGLLMMWPADVLHEVHAFYGRRERVVVNFNINAGWTSA
jgi:hypothetical protein